MATERQRELVLGLLLVGLAFLLYRAVTSQGLVSTQGSPSTSSDSAPSSNGRARGGTGRAGQPLTSAPDVHLRALDDDRPKPVSGDRNLFRFKPKAPPPGLAAPPPPVVRTVPSVPTGPPPLPPIPLKFIGIVEASGQATRIAALVDPMGNTFHGREGDVVLGQYRILKIGVESIEMAYLDGRGRQTIRLSGS
jgi:hypothetical protein